jgi:hypothetical protein
MDDRPGVVTVHATNLLIQQNLFINCSNGIQINRGFQPTTITHNTFTRINNWFIQLTGVPLPPGQLTYQSNVVRSGEYGIVGDATGVGMPSLIAWAPGAVVTSNVIEQGTSAIPYPTKNYVLANGTLSAKLDRTLRYLGAEAGADGTKPGADVDAIQKRIPWATW